MFKKQIVAIFAGLVVTTMAVAGGSIKAENMGLSRASVFEVPAPHVYHYSDAAPGQSKLLPRAYAGAPPQVPHSISDFLPITRDNNMCVACHAQPDLWGRKLDAGTATPIPPSHYTDRRNAPDTVTDHLINSRYNCNQCHVPQTDAPALVENTFGKKR